MKERYEIYNGDCLEVLPTLADASIDCTLADIPYGTTACKWDSVIPFVPMWKELKRVNKPKSAICLFGSEPFSTILRYSNLANYKYELYWDKKFGGNFVQAKRMPLKSIETISVFNIDKTMPNYYPQMIKRNNPIKQGGIKTASAIPIKNKSETHSGKIYDEKFPITLLSFPKPLGQTVHPTQKPVELMRYLIRTYTQEGETVLDFTMGSGTTGVAAMLENRRFIGIEKELNYFEIAKKRIESAIEPLFKDIG